VRQSALNEDRRILVLTLSFGSGHVRAAHSIAQELVRQVPEAQVRIVDALEGCRLFFRAGYVWPYWAMIRFAPSLWARFFAARTRRRSEQTAPSWAFRWGCPKVFEVIRHFQPRTIIAAEVAACELAVIARKLGLTKARIINVITDYEAEPVWVKPEINDYFVPDRAVGAQLHAWGAPAESIHICGIPVAANFHARANVQETRARYGISDNSPVVLLMGGGMGPTRMDRVAGRLLTSRMPMHIVAIVGHDARMQKRLAQLRPVELITLTVLGWTDDVAALMQAATVLVTKPGGLTTAEATACHLPLVLFDAIPGPELSNVQRFAEAGACLSTKGPDETVAGVLYVLNDERARYAMSLKAREVAHTDAARMIASRALTISEQTNISARGRFASA
jgi:processive 1,2-diacylglycerol beta-glucosyltransferase